MALAIAAGVLALLAELGGPGGLVRGAGRSRWPHVVLPLAVRAVGTRLFLMFARALRATEADRNRLADRSCSD